MPKPTVAEELQTITGQIDEQLAAAEKEDRSFTAEEETALSTLERRRDDLKGQLERKEALRKRRAGNQAAAAFVTSGVGRITPAADLAACGDDGQLIVPRAPHRFLNEPLKNFRGPNAIDEAHLSAQFLLAALWRNKRTAAYCEHNGIPVEWSREDRPQELAQSGSDDIKGGYLVPTVLARAIIDLRQAYGAARGPNGCRVWPMSSDHENIPRRISGATAYYVSDNTQITDADKEWDQVTLTARKLACLTKYSEEIGDDAILNMADDLAGEFAYAFAVAEDTALYTGDGTSTYGGIVGLANALAAGSIYTAVTTHTAFSSLTLADLEGCIGAVPAYPGLKPAWHFSKAGFYAGPKRIEDSAAERVMELVEGGASTYMCMGFPVVISQVLNGTLTAQTSTIIGYFGDLAMAATLGSRQQIRIDSSKDRYFEFAQLAIRATERFDINVHERGTASASGAIIALKTPSS